MSKKVNGLLMLGGVLIYVASQYGKASTHNRVAELLTKASRGIPLTQEEREFVHKHSDVRLRE